jgi:hypothetical protein
MVVFSKHLREGVMYWATQLKSALLSVRVVTAPHC